MTTLGFGGVSEESPRKTYREAYRDWIVRNCLSSHLDLSITGASPQYWGDDDVQFASNETYKSMMHFRDITVNLNTASSLLEMLHGSTVGSSWDRGRQYHLDIFCRSFYIQNGIVNAEVSTAENVDKSFATGATENYEYSRGYSRHANQVARAMMAGVGATECAGGSWGAGTALGGTNVPRNQHINALTECQAFLTNQGLMNPYLPTFFGNVGAPARNGQWPAHEFTDSIDSGKGGPARGGFSFLSAFGGFAWSTSTTPITGSGPGGHIRIFALEQFRVSSNGMVRARGNQSAAKGAGGGTIEVITNDFILEGSVTDQMDARGGGSAASAGGGGGGIFIYSPSRSYQTVDQFNTSGRMATGTKGLIMDKHDDSTPRSTKVRGSGLTMFYPIEALPTSIID
jgi:hypothetical protein